MKYFKIELKQFYENDMVAPHANGLKIPDAELYFSKLREGLIIKDAPVFDYFLSESFDKEKYWEWIKKDAYSFIGQGSQISGWLISEKLKSILTTVRIPIPHYYYISKFLFKKQKLDYYIFHFHGALNIENIRSKIDFKRSVFFDENTNSNVYVNTKKEFVIEKKRILKESNYSSIIKLKALSLTEEFDFFPMQSFLRHNIASEKLRSLIESNNIEGFEFSELEYEVNRV